VFCSYLYGAKFGKVIAQLFLKKISSETNTASSVAYELRHIYTTIQYHQDFRISNSTMLMETSFTLCSDTSSLQWHERSTFWI